VCLLVMIGVRADGTKGLIALADGHRESTESWAELLRGCMRRGMRAPGALSRRRGARVLGRAARRIPHHPGAALLVSRRIERVERPAQVRPTRREGRAGRHLQRRRPRPRTEGREGIRGRLHGEVFTRAPRRAARVLQLPGRALGAPAYHQPDESTFATVRLRQPVTKGPGSRAAGIAMAFKLIESAQTRWRAVNAPHLVALVRAGATFERASSSNDPTIQQATDSKPRDTPIHRS
jgi:putative transposase